MFLSKLAKTLLGTDSRSRRTAKPQYRRSRLGVEGLEQRVLLTAAPVLPALASHALVSQAAVQAGTSAVVIGSLTQSISSDSSSTQLNVQITGSNLPSGLTFYIQVYSEVMKVTGRYGVITDGGQDGNTIGYKCSGASTRRPWSGIRWGPRSPGCPAISRRRSRRPRRDSRPRPSRPRRSTTPGTAWWGRRAM